MVRLAPAAAAFVLSGAIVVAAWLRAPAAVAPAAARSPEEAAYRQACGRCHLPFDPGTHRKSEWRGVVSAMHERMGERQLAVAPETLELAIRFLEQNGR